MFKVGLDLQHSRFDGDDYSQQLDVRRLDGSLAERTTYSSAPDAPGSQRHRVRRLRARTAGASTTALMFELGLRVDRDDVVEQVNYSPRAGVAVSVLPEGRGILRGGFGKFAERTPLTSARSRSIDVQTVTRFDADRPAARRRRSRSRTSSRRR